MTHTARVYSRPPQAMSQATAEEFGRDLFSGRVDPSDEDACFEFLADLYPDRLVRDVLPNLQAAIYESGQLYIEAELTRITQDN